MMLPKINASTKIDKWKPLFAPIVHCARMPVSFGNTISLMEAVVEESHSVLLSQVFSLSCFEAAKVHLDIVLSKSKTY